MPSCVPTSIDPPIIPIPFNLLQQISSSLFGPLTFFLLRSPHPLKTSLIFVIWSSLPPPHVPCPSYGCLFNARRGLAWDQFSCISHRQSFVLKSMLPLTLPRSPPSLTWTWITSIDIIDVFHLGLPCPCWYHHISYVYNCIGPIILLPNFNLNNLV
jgi:hypothetical protein